MSLTAQVVNTVVVKVILLVFIRLIIDGHVSLVNLLIGVLMLMRLNELIAKNCSHPLLFVMLTSYTLISVIVTVVIFIDVRHRDSSREGRVHSLMRGSRSNSTFSVEHFGSSSG